MEKSTTVCFTGHRKLPTGESLDRLQTHLYTAVETVIVDGYDTFLFGGCYGFDLLAASVVLSLRQNHPHIKLHAAIPYEEQPLCWTELQRESYFHIMAQCEQVVILQPHFDRLCYKKRNQYMVDHSNRVIVYQTKNPRSGTAQTVGMAQKAKIEQIRLI